MILLMLSAAATAGLVWRARARGWREAWSVDGAVAAAYLLISVGFFWQFWLLPGVAMPRGGGDLVSFLYPTYRFAATSIQSGQFPFWNPHLYGGAPFAADLQSGLYYPPNLLAFLIARPFEYATLETLAALHYPLASLGAYLLGRALGLPRLPSFAVGLVYAYSGFMVAHLGHYNMVAAASWVPVALALMLRALTIRHFGWALAAGGTYGLAILAGHTQVALYTALALTLVWLLWLRARGPSRDAVLALPIVLATGAASAAVLLIPAYELTGLSLRAQISYARAAEFSATPLGLLTFLVPHAFGTGPNDHWGLRWSLQEGYAYLGVAGLVAVAVALATRHRAPPVVPIALLAVLALAIALGEMTPLHGWLYRLVPGFDKVRAPGRALLFVDLAGAALVGFGIARLARPLDWRDRPAIGRLMRVLWVTLAGVCLIALPLLYYAALTSQDKDPAITGRVLATLASANLSALLLFGAGLIVAAWARRTTVPAAVLMTALLAVDLSVAHAGFNPTEQDLLAGYRHDRIIDFLRANVGNGRVDTRTGIADRVQPDVALVTGLDDVGGIFNPLGLSSYDRYWEALGSRSAPGYDLLAVKYLVAARDAPLDPAKFLRRLDDPSGLSVFENTRALPRAFVAPRAESLDAVAIDARLRDPAYDPRSVALLAAPPTGGAGGGTVVSTQRPNSDELIVRLSDVRGGYLVLSQVAYPGWSALVDGRPTALVTAYNALQAVPLAEGASEVRLTFRPRFWTVALAVSLLAWVAIAAGTLVALRASYSTKTPTGIGPWR